MKKVVTFVFALLLGASLSLAQTSGSTGQTGGTGDKTTTSGKKGHKGGKKGKKSQGDTTTTPK